MFISLKSIVKEMKATFSENTSVQTSNYKIVPKTIKNVKKQQQEMNEYIAPK